MDCLICFKIFIKKKEYENISPPKSDICVRSICELLEIQNSPRIEEIFQDPVICLKCYQRLEDVNQKFVKLKEIRRNIEEIRGDIRKDLENSKNVSEVMQNAYGGEMSKSSKYRMQIFEDIENTKIQSPLLKMNEISADPAKGIKLRRRKYPKDDKSRYSKYFYCKIFKIKYSAKSSLLKHMNQHSRIKERQTNLEESHHHFICPECGKPHGSEEELQTHLEIALTSTNVQKCSLCSGEYWGVQCLEYHKLYHHDKGLDNNCGVEKRNQNKTKIWRCEVCNLKFSSNSKLKIHQLIHRPKKFKCSFEGCGKRFHLERILKHHSFCHSEQKPFHCQYCSRGFIDKRSLILHLGDEKPDFCEMCKQDFKTKGCLKHHNSISHGISYYSKSKSTERRDLVECKTCKIYFKSKHLKQHELIHDKPKYKCPEIGCEKLFKRKDYVNDHINIVHKGIHYKCTFAGCEKKFKRKTHMTRHLKIVHKL